ncbi:MAG: hypothetical protein K0S26_1530 [Bacteroidota bacterium]|jgi:hypothetical protein|nr:hypothetical protein [Bacteroidota bacterium]
MKRCFSYSFILPFLSFLGYSQSTSQALASGQDPNVLYRNEMSFGIFAHSRGLGINWMRAKHVTGTRKRLLEVEALNMKHPKEIKISSNTDNSKRFIYGKLNSILMFRAGVGYQTTIFKRSDRKSVEIRTSYYLGGSLAFAKPNYILVYRETSAGDKFQQSTKYDPEVHTIDSISGKGPLVDGMSEMKVYPGLYAKLNLSFEYAPYSNKVKAIETGVIFDYFPKALPIMANNPAENFIVTLYVGFVFGKKWF